jgi:hypothetical protein
MNGLIEVHRQRTRLDAKFKRISSVVFDAELQSDYAKYLCVLTTGFLECALYELLVAYSKDKSAPASAKFIESQLNRWANPGAEKITSLLGSFDVAWRSKIEIYLVDEKKDAVNSLVALRHKIAHGESVGTSYSQVKGYFDVVSKLVDEIASVVT